MKNILLQFDFICDFEWAFASYCNGAVKRDNIYRSSIRTLYSSGLYMTFNSVRVALTFYEIQSTVGKSENKSQLFELKVPICDICPMFAIVRKCP